jgi:hypothetical protein
MNKKAYFLEKKHRKNRPQINNSYLWLVGRDGMEGMGEEETL